MLSNENEKLKFQNQLLTWFKEFHRDFPWRNTFDPFRILVAEKLLQQTVARNVVGQVYQLILSQYPTFVELSMAPVSKLEEIIKPLGFSYRAKELQIMAKEIVENHGGEVPASLQDLLRLTGVGDYCARAVLSFAFGQDVPIVDTNVARFLYRLYGIEGNLPANPARKKSLIEMAQNLLPAGNSRNFNLALLDLCAIVCKPRKPLCTQCPVIKYCMYGSTIQKRHL